MVRGVERGGGDESLRDHITYRNREERANILHTIKTILHEIDEFFVLEECL